MIYRAHTLNADSHRVPWWEIGLFRDASTGKIPAEWLNPSTGQTIPAVRTFEEGPSGFTAILGKLCAGRKMGRSAASTVCFASTRSLWRANLANMTDFRSIFARIRLFSGPFSVRWAQCTIASRCLTSDPSIAKIILSEQYWV